MTDTPDYLTTAEVAAFLRLKERKVYDLVRQGLLLPPGNPGGVHGVADIARPGLRVAHRQPEAGADTLFRWLLEFAHGARLQQRAEELGGYDGSALGAVAYNA